MACALGMRFEEIRLENIGPIKQAVIGEHKLTVFVGPNNSGKSIASRIIHGACQLDMSSGVQLRLFADHLPRDEQSGDALAAARSATLIRRAGIRQGDIVTHSEDSGRLVLGNGAKPRITMNFDRKAEQSRISLIASLLDTPLDDMAKNSIYVPAGRTGTVQSLLAIMQIKSDLLNSVLRSLGESPSGTPGAKRSKAIAPELRLRRQMPEYLEQFYAIVLETFSGGFSNEARSMFTRLFAGSIGASTADDLPAILYQDPSGFAVEIDAAGSGVVSAFPIVATMHRIESGGTLIIEEPETHMEPMRQLHLVNEIVRVALERNVNLVLTTHSDFVVHAILGLVHSGAIDTADLGMYYFRRKNGSYTSVEKIPVTSAGEAEQELFDEALDALAKGSVVFNPP